jgi:hypothetical protein
MGNGASFRDLRGAAGAIPAAGEAGSVGCIGHEVLGLSQSRQLACTTCSTRSGWFESQLLRVLSFLSFAQ